MSRARRRTAERIRHLMETEGDTIEGVARHFNAERVKTTEQFDEYEDLRAEARAIKEDAIERLPDLIDELEETVEANGGHLYLAEDAADANRYVEEVCRDREAETLVKSKSMTTEEIELNEHLEAAGVDVYETDLGEFVIQVADETASHLVGPAIHKSSDEIAALFNERFDPPEPLETPEELTRFARDYLLEHIKDADVGLTGANFVVAESGTIVLVTNEGNARKTAVTPDTYVAVTGVEKIIPSIESLEPFARIIGVAATGQPIPQYITMLSPPVDSPVVDFDRPDEPLSERGADDREFHLVLIDNGRMAMREDDQLRETLYCIRCGACANSCANFQHVGGHAFGGHTYTGGIATGWEAGVFGLDSAAEFNDLCTGCSQCVNACPVKIDIPWINTVVRDRINQDHPPSEFDFLVEGLTPDAEPAGISLDKRVFGNIETLATLASATAPLSNTIARSRPVKALLERVVGIDRRRALPAFKRQTLKKWFRDRASAEEADRTVVLYPDVYTNHVQVDRGKAAVRVLEALGCAVEIPDLGETGRAPLSQGMVSTAEAHAHRTYAGLVEHLDAGHDVVFVEPSDLAMVRREYENFLASASHERLAESSYDVMEYVFGLLGEGADHDRLGGPEAGHEGVAYHSHCQQRTLGVEVYTEAVLDRMGFDVITSDVECCGMAGSFGYKEAYYELSMDVGEPLAEQFADATDREIVASGTSCLEQLEALLDRPTTHPIELIDPGR